MLTKHDKASKKARKILTKACAPSGYFKEYKYSYLEMSLEEINCVIHKKDNGNTRRFDQ
jgi:hypothetical protein